MSCARHTSGLTFHLLHRCLDDVDDEVRDRAAMYLKVLKAPPLAETYVKDGTLFSV